MDIYLRSSKEVIYFCESVFKHYKHLEVHWQKDDTYGHHIVLSNIVLSNSLVESLANSLVNVYYTFHISKTLERILKNTFYFTHQIEIEKIIEHAYFLLFDHRENEIVQQIDEKLRLKFSSIIWTNNPLYFESIIHFQFSNIKDLFIELVGLAIDDFKQEELHQQFIYNVRVFMKNKKTNIKEVHILQGNHFTFYDCMGEEISNRKVKSMLQKEPLYLLGLSTPDDYLSPLIAMAPKKIYIYGSNLFEAKTQSIINIFQEKVTFHDVSEFPFSRSKGH